MKKLENCMSGNVFFVGTEDEITSVIELATADKKNFIFTDNAIAGLYPSIGKAAGFTIEASEEKKSLETVTAISSFLLEKKADRNAVITGIGGGIVTDICGFAASIYKRGIKYVNVPTTLLAQVDASLGGKTGVNFNGYKNILGTITQPEATVICPFFLKTLPYAEIRSGLAELVKTALIKSDGFYKECLEKCSTDGWYKDTDTVQPLIEKACMTKLEIVEQDPFEKGMRRVLNLGHTFGHAIEKFHIDNRSEISHGEAVAEGMIIASEISEKTGIAEKGFTDRLRGDFVRMDLPVKTDVPAEMLAEYILNDKKAEGDYMNFIAIASPGDVRQIRIKNEELRKLCLSLQL